MRGKPIKEGEILFSSVTEIFYKYEKGKLYKYATYAGGAREWEESRYSGFFGHMKQATPKQLKEIEC